MFKVLMRNKYSCGSYKTIKMINKSNEYRSPMFYLLIMQILLNILYIEVH